MNLKIPIIALLFLSGVPVSAQQCIGFQAGFGLKKIEFSPYGGHRTRGRVNLGLNYERYLTKHLLFGADLLYQQRGFSDLTELYDLRGQPVGSAYLDFRYSYIALPLRIGYSYGKKGFGFGKLGIVPAYLTKADLVTPDGIFTGQQSRYDIISDCNRFDLGGVVEAGGGFRFNHRFQLFGSLVYQRSFTRYWNDGFPGVPDKHSGWYLNFGLRYELPSGKPAVPAPATK